MQLNIFFYMLVHEQNSFYTDSNKTDTQATCLYEEYLSQVPDKKNHLKKKKSII